MLSNYHKYQILYHLPLDLYALCLYYGNIRRQIKFAKTCALQHAHSVYHILQCNLLKKGTKNMNNLNVKSVNRWQVTVLLMP